MALPEVMGFSPVFLGVIAVVIIAGIILIIGILQRALSGEEDEDIIETEGMEKKFVEIFEKPTKDQGAKVNDWIKIRSTSSTPRTIGLAIRAKDMDVDIVNYNADDKEYETEKSDGTVYTVIEGSKGIGMKMKKIETMIGLRDHTETYDVPSSIKTVGDDYIWFGEEAHFIKYNGIKRQLSVEGLSRGWETSFSKTHENYLRAQGDIPEQYAVLNNRINGQLKLENMKSSNFRKFEALKNDIEKLDAMEE